MIIRATVNDNDYTYILEEFFNGQEFLLTNIHKYVDDNMKLATTEEEIKNSIELSKRINNIIKVFLYTDDKLITKSEIQDFKDIITQSFDYWLFKYYDEDYSYMMENLKISFVKSLKDKDENGEVVYYLMTPKQRVTM